MSKLDDGGSSSFKLFLIVFILWQQQQQSMCAYTGGNGGGPMAGIGPTGIDVREEMNVRNRKSKEMESYMNLEADPCKDFYDYACGNWAKHQRSDMQEGEQRTAQNLVESQISREIQSMLEEPPKQQDGLNMRKVRDFYATCVKVENPSSVQRNFLLNFIKMHGGLLLIPNSGWQTHYDWVQVIAQLRANYGMDILIGLDIDTNLQSMRGNSIYLGEPKTTLIPPEYCSTIATQEANSKDEVYEAIQRDVATNMQRWLSMGESDSVRFAGDIVRFEFELCKRMRADHSMAESQPENAGPESLPERSGARSRIGQNRLHGLRGESATAATTYPRMSLLQLTQQFDNLIDYQMFVDMSFETRINSPVYIRNEAYLQQLARVTKSQASKHTIAGYILYRAMLELNLPSNDNQIRRPQICVQLVKRYFSKIIGEMYLRRIHRGESRSDLAEIFNEIIKTFDERLENDWMDENDKRAVRQKLTQFKLSFADYQNLDLNDLYFDRNMDHWRKLEQILKFNAKQKLNRLQSGDYGQRGEAVDSYEVRMQIMPMDQEISSGWGLLQQPFYNYYYPKALKFSLLAQRIARELIFAFDEQGWNQNPVNPMRWRSETMEAYRNRSECYRSQYSNYLFNNPESFRNASKLRELIADSSALNIGFGAYLNWLERMDPKSRLFSRETLPNLNFSNTQLFFIYFAQTHCIANQPEEEETPEFLPLERHKPERYDVNGPLSNYEEFGREFGCAVGTEMNNDDRCLIY